MVKHFLLVCVCIATTNAFAQTTEQKDSIKKIGLNEVVVSGNKFSERKTHIVQKIDIVNSKEIARMNAQTTADALMQNGQVFVQKSQAGGGSPVIRGFEASRIQLNIDGIRMNNAIYRTGHLQNILTIDQNALDRIEILSGPASTIHGSDALGGVISLKTLDPKFGKKNKLELTGANALVRYSTANEEKTAGVGIHFGNTRFASFTNLSYSSFGDVTQGKNGTDSIMNLWKKKFIADRINGKDTMIENPNPYKQVATGYQQLDLLQKFSIKQGNKIRHGINMQLSNSSNIPRYDRLTETSAGLPKSAEWYYGPQFRTLVAYQFDAAKLNGFFQEVVANLSHQYIEESRHNRNFGKTSLNHREEKIHVSGYQFAIRHKDQQNEITLGTDGQFNNLTSVGTKTDIVTNVESKIDSRYPDGKNQMNLFGLFFQHILKLADNKIIFNDGLRLNYTSLHSTLEDTSILFHLPILDLQQRHKAITGNIGVAYKPDDELRLTANLSSGFRSPNFDDLAKVFESTSGRIIVPNVDLKPEFTQNAEISIQYDNGKVAFNTYGFFTQFTNAIVTDEFTYNGQDSIMYNGTLSKVYASQNKAKAFIYGGGFDANFRASAHFSIYGSAHYTYGRFNNDSMLVPLDHVAPLMGRIGIRYQEANWYSELYSIYNGRKKLVDYNPAGEDNLQYATPTGMPGWYTINLRAGVTLAKYVQLQAGIENILDKNYRHFASGMSAPGRNLVVAVRFKY